MQPPYIDAYCHVGLPRFSSAEQALDIAVRADVGHSVLVLGPDVPDYPSIFEAVQWYGDRIRGVGIPFGETASQVRDSVALQLRAGLMGLRLEPKHVLQYPSILDMLGEQGRWVYAISVVGHDEVVPVYSDWLERYPESRMAAPHFLNTDVAYLKGAMRDLVQHPRFTPIFSRHGGMGSIQAYPHADFRAWVEAVITLSGWQNVMWGSEYPVIYWRDETMRTCESWLRALWPEIPDAWEHAFLHDTAQRLIFDQPAPPAQRVTIPAWVEAQFNYDRTLQIFPRGLDIPMTLYADLHHGYVETLHDETVSFSEYIIRVLKHGIE